jgi:aminoglycoside phosphotransferase family enzyme/predicted kinase
MDQTILHDQVRQMLGQAQNYAQLGQIASGSDPIVEITTHGARVFLVGDRAFKIKRPIAFAYMDFSSVEKRQRAIENELRLNRRIAPDLYRAIHPICLGPDDRPQFGDRGEIIDWALEMTRFPTEAVLDRVDDQGHLSVDQVVSAAKALAQFHEYQAEPHALGGGAKGIAQVIDVAERELTAEVGTVFDQAQVDEYLSRARQALEALTPLLEGRRQSGQVRLCHGDLHLGNLVALGDRVVPFDCIEFNDEFARIDVLYDLSFLLMDLIHRGRLVHANQALNAYLETVPLDQMRAHIDGMAAMGLFMSARAGVRAHVLGRQGRGAAARAFLAQGIAHLSSDPHGLRLVALGGLQGTGKSTLARSLAPRLSSSPGAIILRSDCLRKSLAGVSATTRLGPEFYTPAMSARTYDLMFDLAAKALGAGAGVILDAVFHSPDDRARVTGLDPNARGLWLEARDEIIRARLAARRNDASDADIAVYERQKARDPGPIDWARLDTSEDPAGLGARLDLG